MYLLLETLIYSKNIFPQIIFLMYLLLKTMYSKNIFPQLIFLMCLFIVGNNVFKEFNP